MSHYSRFRSRLGNPNLEGAYGGFLRLIYVGAGAVGLWASFTFSVKGFNVQYPDLLWLARMIVIMNTALQIAFNHEGHRLNPTLIVGALVSYGYGIWTNIIGLWALGGGNVGTFQAALWTSKIIPVSLGIILETVPETLIVYGLFPNSRSMISDLVGNIRHLVSGVFSGLGGGQPYYGSSAGPYYDDDDDGGTPATTDIPTIPLRKPVSFGDRVNSLTKDF